MKIYILTLLLCSSLIAKEESIDANTESNSSPEENLSFFERAEKEVKEYEKEKSIEEIRNESGHCVIECEDQYHLEIQSLLYSKDTQKSRGECCERAEFLCQTRRSRVDACVIIEAPESN